MLRMKLLDYEVHIFLMALMDNRIYLEDSYFIPKQFNCM